MNKPYVVVAFRNVEYWEMRSLHHPQAILQKDTLEEAQESAKEANLLASIYADQDGDDIRFVYQGMSREDFNKLEG